jgi:signal transduction histidine kinase
VTSAQPSLGLKRVFILPGAIIGVAELAVVVLPLFPLFQFNDEQRHVLLRAAGPVLGGALVVWSAAVGAWLAPVSRALTARRRGEAVDEATADAAYRTLGLLPLRALWLRTLLWLVVAAAAGFLLVRYSDWTWARVATLVSVVGLHALVASVVRAAWTARLVARLRGPLFPSVEPLKLLADRFFRRLVLIALLVGAGAIAAFTGFIYYFLPLRPEEYLEVQTFFPGLVLVATVAWMLWAHHASRPVAGYLRWQLGGREMSDSDPRVVAAYRGAQSLPYRLAGARLAAWVAAAGSAALVARTAIRMESDNAVLFFGAALVICVGAALYEAIWHRETMRPVLVYISSKHRLPARAVRAALSLRMKLLISFGGLVLFACGLSLFWGFIQYKTLATSYLARQAQLTLDWVRSEVQGRAGQTVEPSADLVGDVLGDAAASSPDGAVFYFLPPGGARPDAIGGGPAGAPRLPWYAVVRMRGAARGSLELEKANLAGNFQTLDATWNGRRVELGSVAVLYPGYRGRGPGIQRPLKELIVFFLILFGVSAGIVVLTVSEFVTPIRKLEQRADEMARGELARSVSSGGEGDEVGRLTFALEEMRRALREKIRSTEEVNLDLEREVQRRTADLAKKNKELADALEKLTRAQSQLVHAEKMASIGQLVAGIAHEINNPVNAIANTVGPLRETLAEITTGAQPEIEHMMRVIQNGARRTQSIVQALHNYSRTDDERVVEFDLNRGLDDSLELLRHHLKGHITVAKRYADVGRIRGHAGQLNQVFMNLLTNAAQALAGRDGARIEVVTRRDDGHVIIEVVDNGPGMPTEILPKIFDPFFTTKEVGQGSGLGLSIVHGIVERHGGTIEVESQLGQGTTFTVTLPASAGGA